MATESWSTALAAVVAVEQSVLGLAVLVVSGPLVRVVARYGCSMCR